MQYAKELVEKGEAYYCFCDKERLESLQTEVNGEILMHYDKHCLSLSKEEVEELAKFIDQSRMTFSVIPAWTFFCLAT